MAQRLLFYVNGKRYVIPEYKLRPDQSLASWLRYSRGITSVKEVCGEGGCGACAVSVSRWRDGKVHHHTLASCLLPLPFVQYAHVMTATGIAQLGGKKGLHPVQKALAENNASQCGYCTPGFCTTLYSKLQAEPNATVSDILDAFDGNLCRCTGYRPIIKAASMFGSDYTSEDPKSNQAAEQYKKELKEWPNADELFPEELKKEPTYVDVRGTNCRWYQPDSLEYLLTVLNKKENVQLLGGAHSFPWEETGYSKDMICKLLSGYTDVGPEERYKSHHYPVFVSTQSVKELQDIELHDTSIELGAGTTINKLRTFCASIIDKVKPHQRETLEAIIHQTKRFANNQVRNKATIGGGLVTCHYLSDMVPVWVGLASTLVVSSMVEGIRQVRYVPANKWVLGSKRSMLAGNEVLMKVIVPLSRQHEYVSTYKQARRRQDAQSLTNACMRVKLSDEGTVEDIAICYGGFATPGHHTLKTEEALRGRKWDLATFQAVEPVLRAEIDEINVSKMPPRYQEYQKAAAHALFVKFFLEVRQKHFKDVDPRYLSSFAHFPKEQYKERQEFLTKEGNPIIGRPMVNQNAFKQATGEALYSADINVPEGAGHVAVVKATVGRGRIVSIDTSDTTLVQGLQAIFTYKDIPGKNLVGFRVSDERFLAEEVVEYYGQAIAIVVADNPRLARDAAELVKVEYADVEDPIVELGQAVQAGSFHGPPEGKTIVRGTPDDAFRKSPHVVEGFVKVAGQHHMYLEPQNAVVWPGASGDMVVQCANQNPTNVLTAVATACGLDHKDVEVKTERVGGGFGGRQLRAGFVAAIAAIPAKLLGRPMKFVLDYPECMVTGPGRSPVQCSYRVGFDNNGKLMAIDVDLVGAGGCSQDYAADIVETTMFNVDNTYHLPDARIRGRTVKLNRGPYTATRGFGKPESAALIESIMDHVARTLEMDPVVVRERNLYRVGDRVLSQEIIKDDVLYTCWKSVLEKANYAALVKEVEQFNRENVWRKRGVAVVPSKGNMGFLDTNDINRGGGLVNVIKDGGIRVAHTGVEMGQGINTRMRQVVANQFDLPIDRVFVTPTNTSIVGNTPPTTMVSSDLIGAALISACKMIKERLQPLWDEFPEKAWEDLILLAYERGINLSASDVCSEEILRFDYNQRMGTIAYYFVWGAALSVVEMDMLTATFRTVKTQIVQDTGESLNPALDVGQVEGGFMYGMGYSCLEEMVYAPNGSLITSNVAGYKVPAYDDIPQDWTVSLLQSTPAPRGLHNSKGIGEANIQLGMSVFFAAKDAIYRSRQEQMKDLSFFQLDYPASVVAVKEFIPPVKVTKDAFVSEK